MPPTMLRTLRRTLRGRLRAARAGPGHRHGFESAPRGAVPWLAAAIGLLSAIVLALGSAEGSYDFDETASLLAARLSLPDLATMLSAVDAVHGSYYLLLHGWIAVFGEGELATRSLSALGIGVGAAGLVVLGNRIAGLSVGVVAATVFTVLPSSVHQGLQARPFALGAAATVWAVIALHRALVRGSRAAWLGYAAATALSAYLFLYAVLMLAVHLVVVLTWHGDGPAARRVTRVRWLVAAIAVVAAVSPLALAGYRQREQIGWIGELPKPGLRTLLLLPGFGGAAGAAGAGVALIAAILLLIAGVRYRATVRRWSRTALALAIAWPLLPLALLWAATTLGAGLLVPRYLFFTVPGLALLLALAVSGLPGRNLRTLAVLALILAAVPGYLAERAPESRGSGQDLRAIATVLRTRACPGDAFVLQDDGDFSARPRWAVNAYPRDFDGLDDIALEGNGILAGQFSESTRTASALAPAIAEHERVWVATGAPLSPEMAVLQRVLDAEGFSAGARYPLRTATVAEYVRDGTSTDCSNATGKHP